MYFIYVTLLHVFCYSPALYMGNAALSFIDLLTAMLMCSDNNSFLELNIIWIIAKKNYK